jgi:3D (Asp-Asp-Asp) domain-containing protein
VLAPPWRPLGIAATGAIVFLLPFSASAATSPQLQRLRAQVGSIEHQKRSAILSLYSLDSRLAAAYSRLAALRRSEGALRAQRATLAAELRLARLNARLSQRELAARVRALYDHGSTSTLEVIFGASSLTDALTELDNLHRVTSVDHEILVQVHAARLRELRTKEKLAAREARLRAAIREAGAEARSLAGVRAERSAYVSRLTAQAAVDAQQLARLEAQARAAEAKAQQLTQAPPAAAVALPVDTRSTQATGRTITLVSTGYCLTGTTATGIPVGWGVAAVDPSVIPLGTHLAIPGYGAAVAADTGGSVVGAQIDLWFPTCAQASGWGTRSVTIALH